MALVRSGFTTVRPLKVVQATLVIFLVTGFSWPSPCSAKGMTTASAGSIGAQIISLVGPDPRAAELSIQAERMRMLYEQQRQTDAKIISAGRLVLLAVAVAIIVSLVLNYRYRARALREVREAEKRAYTTLPEELRTKTQELAESQGELEKRANKLADLIDANYRILEAGRLQSLYSKQVEIYQTETRRRATVSFFFAIVSMFSGLAFVIWGGYRMLGHEIAGGVSIAAIGGAMGTFITRTFLSVHNLSLIQLNRYFRQPVINSNIITAQRLADQLGSDELRQKAYMSVISNVAALIRDRDEPKEETAPAESSTITKMSTQRSATKAASKKAIGDEG